jgi:hypothetical protein
MAEFGIAEATQSFFDEIEFGIGEKGVVAVLEIEALRAHGCRDDGGAHRE